MPKLTLLQEERHVHDFLVRTNRPQSVTNIVDALQGVPLKKAAVDRATAALVARGVVTLKEYGKAKVFIADQAGIALPTAAERADLDRRLAELEAAATEGAAAVATASAAVAGVSATLSDDAATTRAAAVAAERARLEARVRDFGGGVVLSEDARAALERTYAQAIVRGVTRKGGDGQWPAMRWAGSGSVGGRRLVGRVGYRPLHWLWEDWVRRVGPAAGGGGVAFVSACGVTRPPCGTQPMGRACSSGAGGVARVEDGWVPVAMVG